MVGWSEPGGPLTELGNAVLTICFDQCLDELADSGDMGGEGIPAALHVLPLLHAPRMLACVDLWRLGRRYSFGLSPTVARSLYPTPGSFWIRLGRAGSTSSFCLRLRTTIRR